MTPSKKLSLVAAAVASALGSSAYALPPSAFTDGTITAANFFYTGGGSAEVQAVFVAARNQLQPATIDVYTDASPTAKHLQSGNYLVVSGTTTGGTNVAFFYKYNGGSFPNGGLSQVGAGSNLAYPSPTDLKNNAVAISPKPNPVTSLAPSFTYTSANGDNHVPSFGITDEELSLFNFPDNLNGSGKQSIGSVTKQPIYVAPFGVAVTSTLSSGAHPKTKFNKNEIAGILTNQVSDWSQLYADDGTALAAGPVWLLDRGSGSGTKAAGNQFFLNYPGAVATGGATDPGSVSGTNVNVYTGTTLNTSLNAFQDVKEASSVTIVDDLQAANKAGGRAIAILGLEFPPHAAQTTANTNDYTFAAVNGVFPDSNTGTADNVNSPTGGHTKYTNIITGSYEFAFQVGLNTHAALTGFVLNIANALKSAAISGDNTGTAFPAATPGVLLDPITTSDSAAGTLVWSRAANSTASPLLINNAATIGGPINFGPGDPF